MQYPAAAPAIPGAKFRHAVDQVTTPDGTADLSGTRSKQTAPPFLRFQLYFMGLPKTASTSLAEVFSGYRTSHERDMHSLMYWGTARRTGRIDDDKVRDILGGRLRDPILEFDGCTSLHWFADLLAHDFPHAKFIHVIRDVQSWTQSLLDMEYRRWIAGTAWSTQPWEAAMHQHFFDDDQPWRQPGSDERLLIPAMRAWADHMTLMEQALPADRTLRIRLNELPPSLPLLANLINVPADRLKPLPTANERPTGLSFDRWSAHDPATLLAAYEKSCARPMSEYFPDQDIRIRAALQHPSSSDSPATTWDAYTAHTKRWAAIATAENAT